MDRKMRLRLATAICLLVLCLQSGVLNLVATALTQKEVMSVFLFLQTGRVLHIPDSPPAQIPTQPQPSPILPEEKGELLAFSQEDLDLFRVDYFCDYRPDLGALLTAPLDWSLQADAPTVLIIHSHATEGYSDAEGYRSLDESENMVAIGEEIARVLEAGGIRVVHDKQYHDHPDYDSSYSNARDTVRTWLTQYPTIEMVLDIHRDATDDPAGQLITSATVGGQKSAQLMMVVGTDASGNNHPNWQKNLSLAMKLSTVLEQENPGICRPIQLRSQRFNMDLTAGSLLVEVGAAGNSLTEAKIAANALAQAVLTLSRGTS